MTLVAIRLARPEEIDALVAIDDDAGTLGAEAGLVMAFDASHPFVVDERARWVAAIAGGLLEVAETPDGTLAGFAARGFIDGEPYLDQLSVRRAWMRRGIGSELLRRAIVWASRQPGGRLWLTTWAHVPWNAPFYARHGFVACSEAACEHELREILHRQREVLPAPDQRIAMVRACAGGGAPEKAEPVASPGTTSERVRRGSRLVCRDRMPLHPKVHALLTAQRLTGAPPMHTLAPEQARAELRAQVPAVSGPIADVGRVEDRRATGPAGSVPVRIYTPPGAGPFSGIVYFHGGGFVIGDLETHDPLCRQVAVRTGSIVCAVDYRLAPEHPFPAAADDALLAARWFLAQADELGADRGRLFVMGDSAGGTLATVTALALRDERMPLRGQILVYPITDHVDAGADSYAAFAEGYGLTRDGMRWFMRHYISDPADATDTRVCPLRMPTLRGLPATFVATAEYDVLRDEGERYVERLREDGVDVTFERADGLHHGFIRLFGILEESGQWIDRIAAWMRRV